MTRRSVLSRLVVCLVASLACSCSSGSPSQTPDQGRTSDMTAGSNPQVLWLSYTNMDEMDLILVADTEPASF